jgi:hypothetical protein
MTARSAPLAVNLRGAAVAVRVVPKSPLPARASITLGIINHLDDRARSVLARVEPTGAGGFTFGSIAPVAEFVRPGAGWVIDRCARLCVRCKAASPRRRRPRRRGSSGGRPR